MTPFQEFAPLLRKRGFRKTWSTRSGGCRVDEWQKQVSPVRVLNLQIWADGKHRVDHNITGCTTTHPSGFDDEASLDAAIDYETTRKDSKYIAREHTAQERGEGE